MKQLLLACCVVMAFPAAALADRSDDAAYVPLNMVKSFPVITVTIGNQQVPLMFDIGGSDQVALSAEALKTMQVESLPATDEWLDASGKRIQARRFRVPEMRIGNVVFRGLTGHEDIEAPGYRKAPVGMGHIAAAALQGYKILLDYRQLRMTLFPAGSESAARNGCTGAAVSYLPQWNGEPVTKAATDLGDLTLVWDTGAPFSLLHKSKVATDAKAVAAGRYRSGKFTIGGSNLGPLDVLLFDFDPPRGVDGFVGFSFLARHAICIDYAGKQLLVRRT